MIFNRSCWTSLPFSMLNSLSAYIHKIITQYHNYPQTTVFIASVSYTVILKAYSPSARSVRGSICLRFSYRLSDEGARSVQNIRQILSHTNRLTEQTRLIRLLLWLLVHFLLYFSRSVFVFRCCRLPYLWACWFCFMFPPVTHSFTSYR